MHGPVERALALAVADALTLPAVAADALRVVSDGTARKTPGEVRLDARALLGTQEVGKPECAALAERLAALDAVDTAVAVSPNVYLTLSERFLEDAVVAAVVADGAAYGASAGGRGQRVLVSFSNPNMNKPLHVGHLRNNFLGCSIARLVEATGSDVLRGQVVSDWGRHICEAAVAYLHWGGGETPESTAEKPDHFVGRHYMRFHKESRRSARPGLDGETALELDTARLLLSMENGHPKAVELNGRITSWAAAGVDATYERIGTTFDIVIRESTTRHHARDLVERALANGTCGTRDDGSVYVDLSDIGLGEVTIRRQDGTLLVYSQLAGAHVERYARARFDTAIVVNGAQWTSGHQIVDTLLSRSGHDFAVRHDHQHYGMVTLPEGQMSSRSGRVVYADAILDDVTERLGRLLSDDGDEAAPPAVVESLAVGLLKYAFLRVPQQRPVAFGDDTLWGSAYRDYLATLSAIALAEERSGPPRPRVVGSRLATVPRTLALRLNALPSVVARAATEREPSLVAQYVAALTRDVRRDTRDLPDGHPMWSAVATALRRGLGLLNADVPGDLSFLLRDRDGRRGSANPVAERSGAMSGACE